MGLKLAEHLLPDWMIKPGYVKLCNPTNELLHLLLVGIDSLRMLCLCISQKSVVPLAQPETEFLGHHVYHRIARIMNVDDKFALSLQERGWNRDLFLINLLT